jgi:concanavalin A-like lectin/glucanase superfamily protein
MNRICTRASTVVGLTCALALIPAYSASAATTVAHWAMNEATGATKMVDSSGHGLTGAITPKVLVGQPGHSGLGYGFAGDGGLVTVPDNNLLDPGRNSYEVELYFKSSTRPSSSVGDYDLIRKGLASTSGGDWKMEILQSGRVSCHFRGSSASVTVTGTSNVVDGKWHRLGCRTTSSGVSTLLNGNVQAKSAKTPGNISNSATVTIGAKNATEDQTTGVLDDIIITTG